MWVFSLDHLLRRVVVERGDAQVANAAEPIGGGVGLALVLGQRQQRRVPGVGTQPLGVGDRQTGVVADLGAGGAFDLVFVKDGRPDAGEIDLRRGQTGRADQHRRRHQHRHAYTPHI
jgi:hypothetical protein